MRDLTPWLLVLLLVSSSAWASTEVRSHSESFPGEGVDSLEIDLPVGQILIEGTDSDTVETTMSVSCERDTPRCRSRAEKIGLKQERRDGKMVLGLEGAARRAPAGVRVKLRVRIPRSLELEIGLGVGDVHVRDTTGDVEIDVGVGDVELEMDRRYARKVELDTGVGKAVLHTDLGELVGSGIVGSGLEWSQETGDSEIEIDTGIGEIGVRLR